MPAGDRPASVAAPCRPPVQDLRPHRATSASSYGGHAGPGARSGSIDVAGSGKADGRSEMVTAVATEFGTGQVLWSMFWFFMFFIWFWLLIVVFADIFRSHDLSGWGKALWTIFVIVLPFLGVFVYLIARGHAMSQRDLDQAQARQQAFNSYVQDVAATGGSTADELTKLADLKE